MDELLNRLSDDRITSRQIDELIGLARGVAADGDLNQAEVEFLQKWLAANAVISQQPLIRTLYQRINDVLADGVLDEEEKAALLETLNQFSNRDFELGEVLKPSTLPLCHPPPSLQFPPQRWSIRPRSPRHRPSRQPQPQSHQRQPSPQLLSRSRSKHRSPPRLKPPNPPLPPILR